jgi:hypothetical protein
MNYSVNEQELLEIISHAVEFQDTTLKRTEKKPLVTLGKAVRYPLKTKDKIKENHEKVYLLLQAIMEGVKADTWSLNTEAANVALIGSRLLKSMGYYWLTKNISSIACVPAFLLAKSLIAGIWHDSSHVLRQLEGVGEAGVKKLADANIISFADLSRSSEALIDSTIGRKGIGAALKRQLGEIPSFTIKVDIPSPSTSINVNRLHVAITDCNLSRSTVESAVSYVGKKLKGGFLFLATVEEEKGVIFKSSITSKSADFVLNLPKGVNCSAISFYLIHPLFVGADCKLIFHMPGYAPKIKPAPADLSSSVEIKKKANVAKKVKKTTLIPPEVRTAAKAATTNPLQEYRLSDHQPVTCKDGKTTVIESNPFKKNDISSSEHLKSGKYSVILKCYFPI